MTMWHVAAFVLFGLLLACAWRCVRGATDDRLISLVFAGELATLALVTIAAASGRAFYLDAALAAAILPYPSAIVFARFYERWL